MIIMGSSVGYSMKVHIDCVPCMMRRVIFQSRLVNNGRETESVTAALKAYADNLPKETNSARLATIVHAHSYKALGVKDPYLELKIEADKVAEKYVSMSERHVLDSDDEIRAAMKVSVIGNIMDFGSGIAIEDPKEFDELFDSLWEQEIVLDDTDLIKETIDKGNSIVYIFDNCGESQFDKILIRALKRRGKRVVGVVRGEPILNDVTYEDALRIGLDKELDKLITTGVFAIGLDADNIGNELRDEIDNASIVITKGMANYESLSDVQWNTPVAFILRAKCTPVANSLGVGLGTNVIKLQR